MTEPDVRSSGPKPNPRDEAAVEAVMLDLVAARGVTRTICPSEVARKLGGDKPDGWSPLMPIVRRVARRLMGEGRVVILRKGRVVDPDDFRGVYRLQLPVEEN